ncbi:hypothetical protein F2Q68_00035475 [Brassica cretica]|uniref:Uncharacterized protein n=2 Tax=Brassica cretica TaxID=69181 RepID=A0A8S9H2Z9_BRACR|nr:hypothetical protein F2Q68_00035475 [Brassica cretica]KAF3596657.1 hypothetical protein DY000_02023980 [Brassica cretica]
MGLHLSLRSPVWFTDQTRWSNVLTTNNTSISAITQPSLTSFVQIPPRSLACSVNLQSKLTLKVTYSNHRSMIEWYDGFGKVIYAIIWSGDMNFNSHYEQPDLLGK